MIEYVDRYLYAKLEVSNPLSKLVRGSRTQGRVHTIISVSVTHSLAEISFMFIDESQSGGHCRLEGG